MLVDQLRRPLAPQQHGERVEPGDDALQFDAFDQEDRNRKLGPPEAVQEMVLQAQRTRHDATSYSSPSLLSPIPRAFSFRCKAERSIPMNDAVREMLPEKRRIWILRYSRSKDSRASRSGLPMIAIPLLAPLTAL